MISPDALINSLAFVFTLALFPLISPRLFLELCPFLILHVRWTNIAALWDADLSNVIILFISVHDA